MNSDKPIENFREDRFGFQEYAEVIAQTVIAMDGAASYVVGIEGPWGFGKTSLLNLIRSEIISRTASFPAAERPIIIRFNPWWVSEAHDLTRVFFHEVAASLEQDPRSAAGLGTKLRSLGARAGKALPLVGALADVAASGAIPGIAAIPGVGAALSAIGSTLSPNDTLDNAYREACETLTVCQRRIIVVIDDLDRLEATDVRSMMKLLKSVADLPYVSYLLAYARNTIDDALPTSGPGGGPRYIKKIIQATFPLPAVKRTSLDKLVQDELGIIVGTVESLDRYRWFWTYYTILQPLIRSPRDAVRFLNSFRVLWSAIGSEVDFSDLVALEAIRLFAPLVHDFAREKRDILLGIDSHHGLGDRGENDAKNLLAIVPSDARFNAADGLKLLFPAWAAKLTKGHNDPKAARVERRISWEGNFDTYFGFSPKDPSLSKAFLDRMLQSFSDINKLKLLFEEIVKDFSEHGPEPALNILQQLIDHVDRIPSDRIFPACPVLVAAGEQMILVRGSKRAGMHFTPDQVLVGIVLKLLACVPEREREKALANAIGSASGCGFIVDILAELAAPHGRLGLSRSSPEPLVDDKTVERLEKRVARLISAQARLFGLSTTGEVSWVLTIWAKIKGEAVVKRAFRKLLSSDDFVVAYAISLLNYGQRSGGDLPGEFPVVHKEALSRFGNPKTIRQRLDDVAKKRNDPKLTAVKNDFVRGIEYESIL